MSAEKSKLLCVPPFLKQLCLDVHPFLSSVCSSVTGMHENAEIDT